MRRLFLSLLTVLVLFPSTSRAQDAPERACDLAAASPFDPTRPANAPGVEVEKIDPEIAVPACQAALTTDPNNPRLLFQMGRAFDAGKDKARARTFYESSVAQGHIAAQNNLALFYEYGLGGLAKDDQQAARLFKLAADSGDAKAQFSLGTFYETGRGGLTKSYEEALRLYKLSADQGEPFAHVKLGLLYANGRYGLPKDETKAGEFFRLATARGNSLGQFYLGVQYEAGRGGLSKNEIEAARLYRLAADQGEPHALARLAWFYSTGRGGFQRNASEASRLCNLAAEKDPTIADRLPQCWIAAPRWVTEYLSRVAKILEAHKRYPAAARLLRRRGTVVIDFTIDRQGQLADSRIRKSSGWTLLDEEALSILRRSQPFPAFPDASSEQRLSLTTPVRFDIR
jgi:TonB family protein